MSRSLMLALSPLIFAVFAAAQTPAPSALPPDSEIHNILVDRIDKDHQSVGIVVGIIDAQNRRVIAHGALDQGDPRPLNGDTVFEIGSVTKVFTALLLTETVEQGEVALDDPVAKYLPDKVKMPQREDEVITLEDLATHTSGLPRLPTNLKPKNPADPYADYDAEKLYQFLSGYDLTRDPGEKYEYSNLGGGLLGHVLARRAKKSYEELVKSTICEPLGMDSTTVTLSDELKKRLAVGHNESLKAVPNWNLDALAGAGALRSTANDLLKFLAANLGYEESALAPAMAAMLSVRHPTGVPNLEIALGWHVAGGADGREIIWHNGGTGGYRSFVAYCRKTGAGVVVLSNTMTSQGIDDIGMHLLDASRPLVTFRRETTIDTKLLAGYEGRYQLAPNFILTVTQKEGRLFVQATGQPDLEVFPESDRKFFYKVVDAQITFDGDGEGKATQLTLHQNGKDMPAKRIE